MSAPIISWLPSRKRWPAKCRKHRWFIWTRVACAWPGSCTGVEMPPRSDWIRMLLVELNRVSSHLMWMATNGMDLGSTSMMIYGFREREMVLAFFEKTTGLRMNHNFIRPGGTAADLPDGWEDDVTVICDTVLPRTDEYDELLTGQPLFRKRSEGIGGRLGAVA